MQRALAVASLLLAGCSAKKSEAVERDRRADSFAYSSDVWQMDAEAIELGVHAAAPLQLQPEDRGPPKGPLDKTSIKREVGANLDRITACYEKRLAEQPRLAGETRVDFTIAHDGHVGAASGTGFDRDIDACVAGVIKSIVFPPPSVGSVSVSYPFRFKPS